MKYLFLLSILCLASMMLHAQSNFNKMWIVGGGNNYTVDFNYTNPSIKIIDTTFTFYFLSGSSSICNSNGRLILMSTGCNILDSNRMPIEGGDSISGRKFMAKYYGLNGYAQASLFLPMVNGKYYYINCSPSDSMLEYVWLTSGVTQAPFNLLTYSIVDMNDNSGNGKVIMREIPLLPTTGYDLSKVQMMACKHANGKDWWLLKQLEDTNLVCKFLFKTDTVEGPFWQGFSEPHFSIYDQSGQSMFSLDGTKYATTCRGTGKVFVADFDRCNGILNNPKVYNVPEQDRHNPNDTIVKDYLTNGLEFSPDGRFLYIAMYSNIMQLDLKNTDSATMWSNVAGLDTTWNAFQVYSSMYLGPDRKIYIGNFSGLSKQMSVIDNPNEKGAACNFCPRCLRFPRNGVTNPPSMPNYDLDAHNCYPIDTTSVTEIKIYPNPVSEKLTLEFPLGIETAEITIFNMLGQRVHSSSHTEILNNKIELSVRYLTRALYSIKIVTDGEQFVGKFVRE